MNIKDVKIYLVDRNAEMAKEWRLAFDEDNVEIVGTDFVEFMKTHKVDCVVSPANSYAIMDGEFDRAISDWFGWDLQECVQKYIIDNLFGEQPVGTSIVMDTGVDGIKLVHTPTMRVPESITDYTVVYHCTRSSLIAAMGAGAKTIALPAFGAGTGCVPKNIVAKMMLRAYKQLAHPPEKISWRYANRNLDE